MKACISAQIKMTRLLSRGIDVTNSALSTAVNTFILESCLYTPEHTSYPDEVRLAFERDYNLYRIMHDRGIFVMEEFCPGSSVPLRRLSTTKSNEEMMKDLKIAPRDNWQRKEKNTASTEGVKGGTMTKKQFEEVLNSGSGAQHMLTGRVPENISLLAETTFLYFTQQSLIALKKSSMQCPSSIDSLPGSLGEAIGRWTIGYLTKNLIDPYFKATDRERRSASEVVYESPTTYFPMYKGNSPLGTWGPFYGQGGYLQQLLKANEEEQKRALDDLGIILLQCQCFPSVKVKTRKGSPSTATGLWAGANRDSDHQVTFETNPNLYSCQRFSCPQAGGNRKKRPKTNVLKSEDISKAIKNQGTDSLGDGKEGTEAPEVEVAGDIPLSRQTHQPPARELDHQEGSSGLQLNDSARLGNSAAQVAAPARSRGRPKKALKGAAKQKSRGRGG
jgi:hypothetical protein